MSRTYGHDGTIHDNRYLDVEVDGDGRVVAVWFRCQMLPFVQAEAGEARASAMRASPALVDLLAVELEDK